MSYSFAGRYYNKHKPFFPYECDDYSFKIDLEYGELYFTRKLISFSGKHLPLNLFLKYIQRHINLSNDFLHADTGFPRGFKTNYHVFLEYDSDFSGYKYEDTDGFLHEFELAVNSSTLYYDTFGSGLMLITENSGYKIFDDDGNYQIFDQYGRLTLIHQKITSSHYAEQSVSYEDNDSLHISSITDNYGRTISFSYTGSYVQISYGNNVVITIEMSNACLTKIKKNIGGHLIEDILSQYYLINNMTLSGDKTISISYYSDTVSSFITNIGQDAFTFSYDYSNKQAIVTNKRNVSTTYDYSDTQKVSQTSNISYCKINSDIASCLIKDGNDNDEITDFTFGNNNSLTVDTSSNSTGYSNVITNNNLQPKKMYLLVAQINGNLGQDSFEIELYDYDNHLLAALIFKGNVKTLSFPVGICSSTLKQFKVLYKNKCSNNVEILKARLIPLIGDFEMLCTNINLDGPIFFYDNAPYYLYKNSEIAYFNNRSYYNENGIMCFDDYLKNERLFYKRNGTTFRFWCNDSKLLFDGVSNIYSAFNYLIAIGYNSEFAQIGFFIDPVSQQSVAQFYSIKGKDDNSFTVTKKSHNSSSFHTGYTSYYYEEEEIKYIAGNLSSITYYDYDSNYLLKEVNRNDGYKETYYYDSNGNLENKVISHTNINKQFVNEYEYDSNDNLVREYKLIGTSTTQIDYGYDSFGNLSYIDYPNQSGKAFTYDSVTGERNLNNHFSAPNLSVIQNNNYIDSDNSSLSVSNDTYLFNCDEGKLVSVSYNNQNILSISYHDEIHDGVILYTGETITYSNGGSTYTEYDAFGRLYITNNCLYSYDDYTNLIGIIDAYYSSTYPTILNEYDYFDQMSSIYHRYDNLLVSFTRDIYHRLTSQTYTYYGNDLYSISYSYYSKPDLENIIKQSSIAYDSSIINVIDNADGFSRLISQSISFGTNAFSKTIEYCVGGSNNTLTNNMISKVSLNYVINGIQNGVSEADVYSYDNLGNIISIQRTVNNNIVFQNQYEYDKLSRLNRENNQLMNRSYRCVYNSNGNISFKNEYAYTTGTLPSTPVVTHTYSYSSTYPSRLTSFDGQTITYDSVGNPITYRGKTLTWIKGTLLSQVSEGSSFIDLTYDGFKQRIKKEVGSNTTNYKYINNQLVIEERTNGTITYLYSHEGVIGFVLSSYDSSLNLNGVYLYEKNIQEDVLTIRDINNQIKAIYVYDAWGNHKVLNPNGTENTSLTFIGNINPIRYRSYYYDTDLKMYWLTTRYYDPEVGRFISPDHYSYLDYQKLHGLNLYAYSRNNPVMYYDPSGHFALFTFLHATISTLFATAVAALSTIAILYVLKSDSKNPKATEEEIPKGIEGKEYYSHELSSGKIVQFSYDSINNDAETLLTVYNSFKLSRQEIDEFLNWLKYSDEHPCSSINIDRARNEIMWHNIGHAFGIDYEATRTTQVFFDSDDIGHGPLSWIINHLRWW